MRTAFASVSKAVFCVLYRICCLQRRRDEVLLLSRQTDEPGSNFLAVGEAFERRGWHAEYLTKKLSRRTILTYPFHVLKEIRLLARCRICILDRYDPVVCLLDFECEDIPVVQGNGEGIFHTEFPKQPVVVQLWHAFGAFKKFGFQSLDTIEGHTRASAQTFGIHRNYSWVVCTGEQNRTAFAEAFACPRDRVVSLGLPEYDDLVALAGGEKQASELPAANGKEAPLVLFAPTLRKSEGSPHPFRELAREWVDGSFGGRLRFAWSFHPLERGDAARGGVPAGLLDADYIVTDYSSIVYEAYLLKKRVLFYVPDIESYRVSPGLNADPVKLAPHITFMDSITLVEFLERLSIDPGAYPQDEFDRFVGDTFSGCSLGTAERIADFAIEHTRGIALA